jgi:hypothetical protein
LEFSVWLDNISQKELAKTQDTLSEPQAIGRLDQVCERWIYTTCCVSRSSWRSKNAAGFATSIPTVRWNIAATQFSRSAGTLDQVFQTLIDRNREPLPGTGAGSLNIDNYFFKLRR